MTTIIVYSVWKAEDRIELIDEIGEPMSADAAAELIRDLNSGSLDSVPEHILDQISSSGADLVDWSAVEVRQ